MEKQLYTDWLVLSQQKDTKVAQQCFETVIKYYQQKHRFYHTLTHLNDVFTQLKKLQLSTYDRLILAHVTLFHDVIYDSSSKENEFQSAQFAEKWLLKLKVVKNDIAYIKEIIIDTATHISDDPLARLFFDMDMTILGTPKDVYEAYTEAIQKEYSTIPKLLYRIGRKRFIKQLLSREWIFNTKGCRDSFEKQARVNLSCELKSL